MFTQTNKRLLGLGLKGILFTLSVSCCVTTSTLPRVERFIPVEKDRPASDFRAVSQRGMVVAGHPLAAGAGTEILGKGGNAVDAAVAASFVISVVRPHSTGLGGGGFLLWHNRSEKKTKVYDFRERAPRSASRNMYLNADGTVKKPLFQGQVVPNPSVNGHLSVATPGLVKGLFEVHRKYGRLKLADVMAPAIKAATLGFKVYPTLYEALEERKDVLALYESSKKIFFRDGKILQLGDLLVQRDLAETLTMIADQGESVFYQGVIGDKIVAEIQRGGGILSKRDLLGYTVRERAILQSSYRGYIVASMPPPSSGGVHIIEMLNMLEGDDLRTLGPQSKNYLHLLGEVMKRAFADRAVYLGDPEFVKVPVDQLTSKAYAKQLRSSIHSDQVTRSADLRNPQLAPKESPSTTHISVVDGEGNAVSTTQTINYSFGSCVVAEGTGIVLNDEMDDFSIKPGVANAFGLIQGEANAIAPEKTPLSSMSPTIVFDQNGEIKMVLGSPGGPRIINAVLQVILNTLDFKLSPLDAVHALRIHHQWLPDRLRYEKGGTFPSETIEGLKRIGHNLEATDEIGDVQAIVRSSDGSWEGVADPRAEGRAVGL